MRHQFFCTICREWFTEHKEIVARAREEGFPIWCPRCLAEGHQYDPGTGAFTLRVRDTDRLQKILLAEHMQA